MKKLFFENKKLCPWKDNACLPSAKKRSSIIFWLKYFRKTYVSWLTFHLTKLDPACHLIQMSSRQEVQLDQFALEELSVHMSTWMTNFQSNQQLQQLQIGHLTGEINHVSDLYKHSKPASLSLITNLASLDPSYDLSLTTIS